MNTNEAGCMFFFGFGHDTHVCVDLGISTGNYPTVQPWDQEVTSWPVCVLHTCVSPSSIVIGRVTKSSDLRMRRPKHRTNTSSVCVRQWDRMLAELRRKPRTRGQDEIYKDYVLQVLKIFCLCLCHSVSFSLSRSLSRYLQSKCASCLLST